jgi:hypothetical protein
MNALPSHEHCVGGIIFQLGSNRSDVVHAHPETGEKPGIGAWTVDPQTDL